MTCQVCDQKIMTNPTPKDADHHLVRSPVDPSVCLGCWMGWLELEKFMFRSGIKRTFWTLQFYEIMREFLQLAKEKKF